ncbi:MAG: hypothetical protein PUB34_04425 [Clostridia bacterium]|nr:hypothetical protein [Clostridia bacterium]
MTVTVTVSPAAITSTFQAYPELLQALRLDEKLSVILELCAALKTKL